VQWPDRRDVTVQNETVGGVKQAIASLGLLADSSLPPHIFFSSREGGLFL